MSIEFAVLDTKVTASNFVAIALIEQFAQRFPDRKGYVLNKAEKIRDQNEVRCILYWFSLDEDGRRVLAERLNVSVSVLKATAEGLRMIQNQ